MPTRIFTPPSTSRTPSPPVFKQAGYSTYFGGKYTNGYDGNAIPPGWDAWFAMVEPINKADSFLYRNSSRTRRYNRQVHNETDVLSVNAERFVRDQAGSSVRGLPMCARTLLTRPTTLPPDTPTSSRVVRP